MHIARITIEGGRQVIYLPPECKIDGGELCVARAGEMVILYPPGQAWDLLERGLGLFTSDVMAERRQPGASDRRRETDE